MPSAKRPPKKTRARASRTQSDLDRAVVEATEREQARLAQALHDTVCQSMSGLHLMARLLTRKAGARCPELVPDLKEFGDLLEQAAGELHTLAQWLRPTGSAHPGLVSALTELAAASSEKIPCTFECPRPVSLRDRYATLQLYHLAQNSVALALRHKDVTRITLSLGVRDEQVELTISFDGAPFPTSGALPLDLLRQRAGAAGPQLTLESTPKSGAIIHCRLPLPNA